MDDEIDIVLEGVEEPQTIRKTSCQMTKYEYTALIIERAEEISSGKSGPKMVTASFDPIEIARQELHNGLIPFIIERNLPDGTIEKWSVGELIIADH